MQKNTGREIEMQEYTGKDSEQLKIIKEWLELLQRGAKKIEAQDNKGMTALHHAVSKNNEEAIQSLLDNGADLYAKDNQEKTPLDIANEGDNEETKKVLLAEMKKDLQRYEIILKDLSKSTFLSQELQKDIKKELETVTTVKTFSEVHNRATTLNELQKRANTEVKEVLYAKKIEELSEIGIMERNKKLFTAASKGDVETVRAIKILDTEQRRVGYELETAANKGHAEMVKELLSGSVWIDPQDGVYRNGLDRMSALLINTAKKGHAEVMKALLKAKNKKKENFFDIESRDMNDNTALMWAAREGHLETVKVILHHSEDAIKAINTWKETALMWAAVGGHAEIVEELLKYRGCDINAINNGGGASRLGGQTALMCAVENDNIKTVEALLDHAECKINMRGRDNVSALMIAARTNNIEIAKLMLPRSNPGNIRDSLYYASEVGMVKMILDHAAYKYPIAFGEENIKRLLDNAVTQNNKVMVKGLLAHLDEHKEKLSYVIQGRDELLNAALEKGNPEVVKALLDSLANTPAANKALEYAVGRRNKDLVGAIVSSKKCGDSTIKKALEMAIDNLIDELSVRNTDENTEKWVNSARETIKSILSYGKWDIDIIDEIKKLPSKQIKEILTFKDKDGKTALHYAVISGDKKFVQKLLNRGANIDEQDNEGMTALHHAAIEGHLNIVEVLLPSGITGLLKRGAQIEAQDDDGMTALHHAVRNGKTYIVEDLLKRGAKIEAQDNEGMTALDHAVINGNKDIIKELLQRGAKKIEAQDNKGMTALHHAVINGKTYIVEDLLKRGAKIEAQDNEGMTALDHAVSENNKEAIQSLLDNGADLYAKDNQEKKTPLDIANEGDNQETKKVLLAEMKKDLQRYEKILTALSESTVLSPELQTDIKKELETTAKTFSEVHNRVTTLSELQKRAYTDIVKELFQPSEPPMDEVLDQEEDTLGGSIQLTGLPDTERHQKLNQLHKDVLERRGETESRQKEVRRQGDMVPPREGENEEDKKNTRNEGGTR